MVRASTRSTTSRIPAGPTWSSPRSSSCSARTRRCRCRPLRSRAARAEDAMTRTTAVDGTMRAAMPPAAEPVIRTIAMPADTNPAGDIFGGWLMAQMDLAAGNVATRRARGRCATVAVEAIAFLNPVLVGDEVSLYGHVAAVGRTSLRIAVEAWRRGRDSETNCKVTEAIFTFVAIDPDRRPRPLPIG